MTAPTCYTVSADEVKAIWDAAFWFLCLGFVAYIICTDRFVDLVEFVLRRVSRWRRRRAASRQLDMFDGDGGAQ